MRFNLRFDRSAFSYWNNCTAFDNERMSNALLDQNKCLAHREIDAANCEQNDTDILHDATLLFPIDLWYIAIEIVIVMEDDSKPPKVFGFLTIKLSLVEIIKLVSTTAQLVIKMPTDAKKNKDTDAKHTYVSTRHRILQFEKMSQHARVGRLASPPLGRGAGVEWVEEGK